MSTLINSMGREAEQIYKSLSFKKKEEGKKFDVILNKFHAYFMLKKCNPHVGKILPGNAKEWRTDRKIHQRIIWIGTKLWFP